MLTDGYREQEVAYAIGSKKRFSQWLDTFRLAKEDVRQHYLRNAGEPLDYPSLWVREWELVLDLTGNIDSELL